MQALPVAQCVQSIIDQRAYDISTLQHIRDTYRTHLRTIEHAGSDEPYPYAQLCKHVSHDTRALIARMYTDAVNKMGPQPCKMCLFATGSLSRDEAGLITDLEIGLLLEHKTVETLQYAYHIIQHIVDRVYLLGETQDVGEAGIRIDDADHAFLHHPFNQRYSEQSPICGDRLWIVTPSEMAQYHDDTWITQHNSFIQMCKQYAKRNTLLQSMYNQMAPYYSTDYHSELYHRLAWYADIVHGLLSPSEQRKLRQIRDLMYTPKYINGDSTLLQHYIAQRDAVLNRQYSWSETVRQKHACHIMKKDLKRHTHVQDAHVPDMLDIKRSTYRLAQSIVTQLARWCNIEPCDTIATLDKLFHAGWINAACYHDIAHLVDFTLHIRLRQQAILQKQIREIPANYHVWKHEYHDIMHKIQRLQRKQRKREAQQRYDDTWSSITHELNAWIAYKHVYEKLNPGHTDAILSPAIISEYAHTYMPIARRLYDAAWRFINGDRKAFMRWKK